MEHIETLTLYSVMKPWDPILGECVGLYGVYYSVLESFFKLSDFSSYLILNYRVL